VGSGFVDAPPTGHGAVWWKRRQFRADLRRAVKLALSPFARSAVLFASFLVAAGPDAGCATSAPAPAPVPPAAPTGATAVATPPETTAETNAPVVVQILAINDFHGNLAPPAGTNGIVVAAADDPIAALPGTKPIADAGIALVPAGGAAFLATHVAQLRAANPATVVVSAGDLTGASPLLSNIFKDEPSILVMNRLGLDVEAVGNHDFDRGVPELRRLQHGGCSLGDCDGGASDAGFPGASFTYLAANVIDDAEQKTVFPPYVVRDLGGVKIAIVGETLKGTPSTTLASSVKGLTFADEAKTVNALVPELKKAGAAAIVLVLHQGGQQAPAGTYDSCVGFSGDLVPILDALDPAVDVVVSAHTHQAYDCTLGGRLVTSAGSYGRLVTKIDLSIDRASNRVVGKHARNVAVTRDVPEDPEVQRIVAEYQAKGAAITGRVVGYVKGDFVGSAKAAGTASCETPLGDLIADAQQAATHADVAFMNPGGIRADLVAKHEGRPDFALTYAEAFEAQPFGNTLATLTLTGAQIRELLEGQFGARAEPRILQVSKGFSYRYTYDRATRRGSVDAIQLAGKPVVPSRKYRVTVNSFLAGGGDGFAVLKAASDRKEGGGDLDALTAYLAKVTSAKAPLEPPRSVSRIQGDGCK
jgi:5'-nucleotidase